MSKPVPVYVFRDNRFAPAGNTVVTAAPIDVVVAAYGGGGIKNTGGLRLAFGGSIVFQNSPKSDCYLGVWGARNASKFRTCLKKSGVELEVIDTPPPARLAWYSTGSKRKS